MLGFTLSVLITTYYLFMNSFFSIVLSIINYFLVDFVNNVGKDDIVDASMHSFCFDCINDCIFSGVPK